MKNIRTLLLGGGYTLAKLAKLLDPETFVITARTDAKIDILKKITPNVECLDISNFQDTEKFFIKYPEIDQIIDSVPPMLANPLLYAENIVRSIQQTKPKRLIYLSTTGVFGINDGAWIDENTDPQPQHQSALARLAVEEYYRNNLAKTCAFRISAIYGPGRGIGIALKNKTLKLVDSGQRWSNRIHVSDLAQILKLALASDDLPKILALADDQPEQLAMIVKYYCEKFNLAAPENITDQQAIASGMYHFLSNQRISNNLVKQTFNYQFQFPSYLVGAGQEFETNSF